MALDKEAAVSTKVFLLNDFGDTSINGIRSAENANGRIYDTNGRYHGTDASRLSKGDDFLFKMSKSAEKG